MRSLWVVFLIISAGLLFLVNACQPAITISSTPTIEQDPFKEAREKMVKETIEARGVADPGVLRAMRTVRREYFVPDEYLALAYADHPLPIGYGQTISQPYIVAWMTELLDLKPGERVLEIGTGSGYQAAVLAELGYVSIYTIEIIPELAESARNRLIRLGYQQVHVKTGDGYFGWEEYAPYNAIIVTAAPDHLPPPLVDQLAPHGRIVVPIGPPGGYQSLWKFVNEGDKLKAYNLGGVLFVPLTGEGTGISPPTQP
ncbi:MAG: protein-L-isoaspartate(D-aspartate) O-methyltransferase [Anaerolineales bacterium]